VVGCVSVGVMVVVVPPLELVVVVMVAPVLGDIIMFALELELEVEATEVGGV
jgi:hypothetical protein